jgi:hypothetical protein
VNEGFPPLSFLQPYLAQRRPEKPRLVPTPPEVFERRALIAQRFREQIAPIAERLQSLSDAERKAVFYKLEHEAPISLDRTGLRPIAEASERITLAVPRSNNLDKLAKRLEEFEVGEPKFGMLPNAQLVARLKSIQEGDPKDRLSEELFANYDALTQAEWVICEIEMLSLARGRNQVREELSQTRLALAREFGNGVHGTLFEHEEIKGTCRAMIRCTGTLFKRLVEDREWQTKVSWFEARPEFETFFEIQNNFRVEELGAFERPEEDAPVVCVVDTGVTSGNPFLRPVTRDDLLKSFLKGAPDNPSDEFGHGSGVASLVSYYALNLAPAGRNEGKVWIAGGRVLNEHNDSEARLFSSALKEVVEFFVPLGVKIFNLSVNARNLRWNRNSRRTVPRGSWLARRIDHLSKQYDVIFVVSTGNISPIDVRGSIDGGKNYPGYLMQEDSSILDPGQSVLAVTVGAVSPGTLAVGPGTVRARALAVENHPAPFTRSGPGIRRAVKPELVDYGGNFLLDDEAGHVRPNPGLSIAMASNRLTPALKYDVGSSFATPRVSHKLAMVLSDLRKLGLQPSASLLKAFLVNSAQSPLPEGELEEFVESLRTSGKNDWMNILGYGVADYQRATYCDQFSVVLYHEGEIPADSIIFIDVPVPASLQGANQGTKRLTVTVAHAPDVQRWGLEEYLGTVLKWRMFRGDVARDDVIRAMSREEDESTQDPQQEEQELPNELSFSPGINLRSRGCVQHAITEWKTHKAEYSANHYTLAIASYERWGRANPSPVTFGVVVRIEETTRSAEIYADVQNALVELEVQTRARNA